MLETAPPPHATRPAADAAAARTGESPAPPEPAAAARRGPAGRWRRAAGAMRGAVRRWFDTAGPDHAAGEAVPATAADADRIDWLRAVPFIAMHLACLLVFWVGVSPIAVAVAVALYAVRMFAITGFYHRYFSHRTFRTSRALQFVFALIGASSVQRGPIWWAAHHRNHHRHADTAHDVHSPVVHGFWRSHVGWFLTRDGFRTDWERVRDLARYPELRWLDRYDILVPVALAVLLFAAGIDFRSHTSPSAAIARSRYQVRSSSHQATPWRAAPGKWWWLLCQPSPKVSRASQRLLRLSSRVSKRRRPYRCASELMVTVAWNSTTVETKKPHTSICGPLVPNCGAVRSSSAPRPYRAAASSTGTTVS